MYCFHEMPAVKDLIEAIGIPHTEVDLILINGKSVGCYHRLRDGDDVSVYPEIVRISLDENRSILTRDRRLLFRKEIQYAYCIRANHP